ncbi:MAG: GTPase ObgE [Candidatus Riflebacteria bacterium]|nr:GTPase ObgE [Candidatus Riflebacteria bacterium]
MKFVDQLTIEVEAGKGGDGMIAFRREKFVPFGGPSGGDGGRGGDVILVASRDYNTLYELGFQRRYIANEGEKGGPKDKFGHGSPPVELKVPVGTLIYDEETGELLADLDSEGSQFIVAKGGNGGRGNAKFASSTRRAPRIAEKGEPGEKRTVRLELKLLADVGLVGLPNAGKSTLLNAVSNARPKIADYPFTTLHPYLGIVKFENLPSFCMADLPGLIEGAHAGTGLGTHFLKHIERTRLLLHLVDLSTVDPKDPLESFEGILRELKLFKESLLDKPMLVVGNKMDITEARELWPVFSEAVQKRGYRVFSLSGATGKGLPELLKAINELLAQNNEKPKMPEMEEERYHEFLAPFSIERISANSFMVTGREIERLVQMTDFTTDDGVMLFRKKLKKLGFMDELSQTDGNDEDTVIIGEMEFEFREFFI